MSYDIAFVRRPKLIQGVFNGLSSVVYVDGSSASGNAGTNNWGSTGNNTDLMHYGGSLTLQGNLVEGGLWPIGFTATQAGNLNSNQHSYWGF